MAPDAMRVKKLLYISAQNGSVYVYDYQTGAKEGVLAGFNKPAGQCVDSKGDVWITNFGGSSIVEYARGGTAPIETLGAGADPIGCSVAPNGDLAVSANASSLGDAIEVWKPGSTTPTIYPNGCDDLYQPGYDNHNNLFVESSFSSEVYVCELPANGTAVVNVNFNKQPTFIGNIMWDGRNIAIDDPDPNTTIYRASESGSGGLTLVSTTTLTDKFHHPVLTGISPIFIVGEKNTPSNDVEGTTVVGPNAYWKGRFAFWKYPAGGDPARTLTGAPRRMDGESVSVAP